uniref:Beta-sarcoglycan n=1 Tax=Alona affinis TaxID=381656 RepID=A0A9N6ZF13_9CRUS|nr:EOG090X0F7H [Alona affinis]
METNANGSNNVPPSRMSTLSRAEKALIKRNVHRPSVIIKNMPIQCLDENSAAHDEVLRKKAKNQPRGYAFWALVFALSVIALCNFFLTITIFSVLRLTKTMEAIEVVPGANLIKFFGEFEVNNVVKADGIVTGFNESPVSFTSHGADLNVKVHNDQESELHVGLDRVEFLNVDSFEMTEPPVPGSSARVSAFSTIFPNFGLPKGVQRLHIKKATANRITSGLSSPLLVRSENTMRLKGNEGISIRGREVIMGADQDLLLRTPSAPMMRGSRTGSAASAAAAVKSDRMAEYKLCICMPAGQLFRIPVLEGAESIQCDSVDLSGDLDNPCV